LNARESRLPLRAHVQSLYRSTTLRAALIFGFAGVAHMLGTLLLARQLPPLEFAGIALFLAFAQVGTTLGMAGAETIVVRHTLAPTRRLLATVMAVASLVAVALAIVSYTAYDTRWPLAAITFAAIVASAVVRVDAAFYQSRQRFRVSLALHQSYNFALLFVALWAGLFALQGATVPCALMTVSFVLMAAWGWRSAVRSSPGARDTAAPYPWKEAWPILGFGAAGILTLQAERLLIPQLLSVELLATFAVLAAVAGSPFHMLSQGAGYTMMPRLKNSGSPQQCRRNVRNEMLVVGLAAAASAVLVLLLAPWLAELLTAGKYTLSTGLVGAAVFSGWGKVVNGFVSAVVRALGTARDLRSLNVSAWVGLVFAVIVAVPAARYGLIGLVVAVGLGWLLRSILVIRPMIAALAARANAAG
jgi:O-antigen/teichoic acid export membrane protein